MLTADYTYEVDWNNDGLFTHAYSDISSYCVLNPSQWRAGRSAAHEYDASGYLAVTLDNSSSSFSSFNEESPLSGLIIPNLRVRVKMVVGATTVTMFSGFLDSIIPVVGNAPSNAVSTAILTAHDVLGQFNESETSLALQENEDTGANMDALLDASDYSEMERAIDAGLTTMSKFWSRPGSQTLQVMRELARAELGRLRAAKNGYLAFENREHIFLDPHDEPQATYGTGVLNIWNLRQENPRFGIFNIAKSDQRTFNLSDEEILITINDIWHGIGSDPIIIPAAFGSPPVPGTRTVYLEYPVSTTPADHIGVREWGMVDYEANANANGTGDDITPDVFAVKSIEGRKLRIDFSNWNLSAAHMVVLRASGVAIVEQASLPLVASDTDENLVKNGKHEYPYVNNWITDADDGQDELDYIVSENKSARPRLTFDVHGNYDLAHLQEVQKRECGDRIRVVASLADFGLAIDAEFIIDSIAHSVDAAKMHSMTIACTKAPTTFLPASGTAFNSRTHVRMGGVPDNLWIAKFLSKNKVTFACYAKKYNATISQAEFRARLVPIGQSADHVDLLTPEEGGTLVHNGEDQYVVTGLTAVPQGVFYRIKYGTNLGRWYGAFRLRNAIGWSDWSDGNELPYFVLDYVDTEGDRFADYGPPEGWTVAVKQGPTSGTAIAVASRPPTNGKRILWMFSQLLNTAGVSPAPAPWLELDANTGPAITRYDGSEIDHVYDPITGVITNLTSPGGDFGDAAVYGGIILIDKRQGQFEAKYTSWVVASPSMFSGNTITGVIGFDFDFDPDPSGFYQQVRLKVVRPPWEWDTDGYLGQNGFNTKAYWDSETRGDLASPTFESDPMIYPDDVDFSNLQARVWFGTDYNIWHGDVVSPNGIENPDPGDSGVVSVPIETDPSGGYQVIIDCSLGSVFDLVLTEDVDLQNFINMRHGRPVMLSVRQDAVGGHSLTIAGSKFTYGSEITESVIDIGADPYHRSYFGFIYNSIVDKIDIVAFVSDYSN